MWGEPGVSQKLRLSNDISVWGSGGYPVTQKIKRGDILSKLHMLVNAAQTNTPGTGSIATDVNGPYNLHSRVSLGPSNSAKIVDVDGYALNLINLIKSREDPYSAFSSPDLAILHAALLTDVYSYGNTASELTYFNDIPVSQVIRSFGGEIGMWQLAEQTMNMLLSVTPNTATPGSPYAVGSLTPGQAPFLLTGNGVVTIATPTIDVVRELWKNPVNPSDLPPFDYVSVWVEDIFENSATKAPSFTFPANSGLLARAIIDSLDSGTGAGMSVPTYLSNANAIQLMYGTSQVKDSFSGQEKRTMDMIDYGFLPPQGVFFFDWLGRDLTLVDILDTATLLNTRLALTMNAALPANSKLNCIYQLLQPVVG